MKIVKFIATGIGAFPLDMLRYDHCWPSTSDSVSKMTDEGHRGIEMSMATSLGIRDARNAVMDGNAVTVGRWNSFGWEISDVRLLT